MNSDSTRRFRKPIQFAIGVALLVLTGWLLTAWLPKVRAHESSLTAARTPAVESDASPGMSIPSRSHLRETQETDERIRNRVESMLTIKPDEIAIITVPKAALDQCLGEVGMPSMAVPVLSCLLSKSTLKTCLEGVLREEGSVKVMVGDENATEYEGDGFRVKVTVTEKADVVSNVQVEMAGNGFKSETELSVYPGHSLVFRFPAPAEVGVVILIGKGPGPTSATTNPNSDP